MLSFASSEPMFALAAGRVNRLTAASIAAIESFMNFCISSSVRRFALPAGSFDGDRLCQVARFVDVGALGEGGMIGEQLQRHRMQDGAQVTRVFGHADDMHPVSLLDMGVCIGEYIKFATACAHFLQVGLDVLH